MSAAPDSLRCRVWRYVRDAGMNGVARGRVAEHFRAFDADQVGRVLDSLKAGNFLSKGAGRGGVFRLTGSNRAPDGETLVLGAGREDLGDDSDDAADQAHATKQAEGTKLGPRSVFELGYVHTLEEALVDARSRLTPPPEPAAAPAPRQVSHIDALASWKAAPAPIPLEAAECALGPRFRAALTSDSTLELQLKTGCVVELGADDTRLLFAWFDRLRGVVCTGASA